jgi:hypothetical protein
MSKMLEMIQQSAVPANIMRSAAHGALALPEAEMLEILVHLSSHALFGEQARMTLAQWDEASARQLCSDPHAPLPVIAYFLDSRNWRPALLPVLIENPEVNEHQLMYLAEAATREVAGIMLASSRVLDNISVLKKLHKNPRISAGEEHAKLHSLLLGIPETDAPSDVLADEDKIIEQIKIEHAEEIAADAHKKFELVKADADELDELAEMVEAVVAKPEAPVEAVAAAVKKEPERLSTIQKITRMTVGERVQLAVKGTKDERFVLIRDGSKVVAIAVLQSPKLSDAEMEQFAMMKNVQQSVLRGIAGNRKFMKQYAVVRALTANPRCPVDISLKLLPSLLISDLQNLSKNKNVSDTIRKIALKLYKDKTTTRKT